MKIIRGIYGLPQSGKLANKLLKERLEVEDYIKVDHTPGLFKHKLRPIWSTLLVDNFEIKYIGKEHINHLLGILNKHYDMETDWNSERYCGITLDWNYKK